MSNTNRIVEKVIYSVFLFILDLTTSTNPVKILKLTFYSGSSKLDLSKCHKYPTWNFVECCNSIPWGWPSSVVTTTFKFSPIYPKFW